VAESPIQSGIGRSLEFLMRFWTLLRKLATLSPHLSSDRLFQLDCRTVTSLVWQRQVQARHWHSSSPYWCGYSHFQRLSVLKMLIR